VETLASTGPPLGLIAGATRAGADAVLAPGDLLVLYTDGLTEATAEPRGGEADEEEYGEPRLAALCSDLRRLPLDEMVHGIEEDLVRFTGGALFRDDRTLVLARRMSDRAPEI
jgi:sigma-B regulation protein RsbU (phosphoserine phosphatase)